MRLGTAAAVRHGAEALPGSAVDLIVDYLNDWWISGSQDGTIRLWNGGDLQHVMAKAHTGGVYSLALLPDGRLCSGSDDRNIAVTNLHTGHTELTLTGHRSFVLALVSLDDGRLVSCSDDKSLRVWSIPLNVPPDSAASGAAAGAGAGAGAANIDLAAAGPLHRVNSTDSIASTNSTASTLSAASANSGAATPSAAGPSPSPSPSPAPPAGPAPVAHCQQVVEEAHAGDIFAMVKLPDGTIATASYDKTIKIWSVENSATQPPQCLHTLRGHTKPVTCLSVLPDGRLISGSYDNTVIVWSLLHTPQFTWPCPYVRAIWTGACTGSGGRVPGASTSSSASGSGLPQCASNLSNLSHAPGPGGVGSDQPTDCASRFYTVSHFDRSVSVWSLADGSVERTIDSADADAHCLGLTTLRGNRLVVGCENDSLELWTFAGSRSGSGSGSSGITESPSGCGSGSGSDADSPAAAAAAGREEAPQMPRAWSSPAPSTAAPSGTPPPLVRESSKVVAGTGGAVRCVLAVA